GRQSAVGSRDNAVRSPSPLWGGGTTRSVVGGGDDTSRGAETASQSVATPRVLLGPRVKPGDDGPLGVCPGWTPPGGVVRGHRVESTPTRLTAFATLPTRGRET